MIADSSQVLSDFATRLRGEIAKGQALPDEVFGELARELFGAQFSLNPAYRRLVSARGLEPKATGRWQDLPAVPTVGFKEAEFSCLPVEERTDVFHSSGTTGQRPSRHFHGAASLELYRNSALAWFRERVLATRPGDRPKWRLLILTPSANDAPHSSLARMFEFVRREISAPESVFLGKAGSSPLPSRHSQSSQGEEPAGVWTLELEAVETQLRLAARAEEPVLLLGTAFSFVHVLDHLAALGLSFRLPPGSKVMETGGYKGRSRSMSRADLHGSIGERLGVRRDQIVSEYGMSELSSQAYDSGGDGRFQLPPWARCQVISPETGQEAAPGEVGLLKIVDLANTFSVLAVQTEDLAVARMGGFELLGRATAAEPRGCSLTAA